MSLGLSLTKSPTSSEYIACGPTIPKDCKGLTTYNGMCLTIKPNNAQSPRMPEKLRDCPTVPTDIAFLLDGSGSVDSSDFTTMKNFVSTLVNGLKDRNFRFAVAQFSRECTIHFGWSSDITQMSRITQQRGPTNTAKAINKLVDELFIRSARKNANRVLVVITDGESTDGGNHLYWAAVNAQNNNIIRYAIGVGDAFRKQSAHQELQMIASSPADKYVFQVRDFSVLNQIQKTLEANIIAIEGTQTGESAKLEFAQDGFSAGFAPDGEVIMSAVGAYQWKGGYHYRNVFKEGNDIDSYTGYSMAVAKTSFGMFVILGAPRAEHKGKVILSSLQTRNNYLVNSPEPQIGSYYGAEVCTVDLNSDSYADLFLVSAPLYYKDDQEGKVFIFTILHQSSGTPVEHVQTLKGMPGQRGRFGLTLASPADLNGDGFVDVVVGAPLEGNGQGSIYIFNGRQEDINPTYSQRISGSSVSTELRFFGFSLSQSALDHSKDNLPDLAIGAKGAVLVLRSRPIVRLETSVTFNPSKIPTNDECVHPLKNTLTVCFTMTSKTAGLSAEIQYTVKLDAKRLSYRAFFSPKNNVKSDSLKINSQRECKSYEFSIEACPKDALNPLINEISFQFKGLPNQRDLSPVLHPSIKNTSDHNLGFEINCGPDNICIDDLKVDFNFSGASDIKVGIMQEMNVTVFVQNRGENSYNSRVILEYPFGLSFRRFTSKQGRLECMSVDSDQKADLGQTTCYISKPIFKNNAVAVFEVTYSINKNGNFDRMVKFTATASSDNDKHADTSEVSQSKTIGVKYAIYVAMIRHEQSSIHINFTAGKNDLQKPIQQVLKVQNDLRDLNFTIFIRVPVKLGNKNIWASKNIEIEGCTYQKDDPPQTPDFKATLQKQPELNCSVAACSVFACEANLTRGEIKFYNISGNVSSGWIEQTGLRSAIFELVSTATMDYNQTKYIYFSSDSSHIAPSCKMNTQVEVYEEKFPLKEIIGGAIGGLLLLALIAAGLYKAGFFKSNYKKMLEDAGAEATGLEPGGESAPPQ
ncbi:integrin alpha-M-like isoform X2 [Trichomycterus rosablanca]